MPKRKVSAKKRAAGKRLHTAQLKKARALYNKSKSKFDKMAKAWCAKKHSNKKKKSKKTGNMYNYNVYMQFASAVIKAGGTAVLAQILWAKHCKKYHTDKTKKKPARKSASKSRKSSSSKSRKSSSSKTRKSSKSSKKEITSGPTFKNAGSRLKKLRPKVKLSGKSYNTLAKRRAAIAKAKK
jgi:cobalamin biosynthesis Mg chelatase CobN